MKLTRILLATTLTFLSTSLFAHTTVQPPCTDSSQECMIKIGTLYLNAVVNHDASNVPFTADVKHWDNGVKTTDGADQIRYFIKNDFGSQGLKGYRDLRWFVDGNDLLALYLIDVNIPYTNIFAATTRIAEHIHITNGMIDDIEAIFCTSAGKTPEDTKMKNKMPFVCSRSLV